MKIEEVEEGLKYDEGKPRLELIPPKALLEVAKVFTFGSKKYGDFTWNKGIKYNRLLGSTLRHLNKFQAGEDLDKESKEKHLAHAVANILMILELQDGELDKELDNRHSN